ncbi:MAG: hypothetical protein WDN46_15055 [Methylocella sp.]
MSNLPATYFRSASGETRILPDDVAVRLEASGDIAANLQDWPKKPFPAQAVLPVAASSPAPRHGRRQTYLTK